MPGIFKTYDTPYLTFKDWQETFATRCLYFPNPERVRRCHDYTLYHSLLGTFFPCLKPQYIFSEIKIMSIEIMCILLVAQGKHVEYLGSVVAYSHTMKKPACLLNLSTHWIGIARRGFSVIWEGR